MSRWFTDVDAWIVALAIGVAMLAAWGAAWRWGRSHRPTPSEGPSEKLDDAVLALLGLLLAFTFSVSLSKHEQRREMSVNDANAIGDFYTSASLLQSPVRSELQAVLRKYVERRATLAQSRPDEAQVQRYLDEVRTLHAQMQTFVARAVNDGTPVVVPLVNTLNDLTSSHAARLAAVRDRLPPSIVLLLGLAAVVAMGLVGRRQAISGETRPWGALCFAMLVCLVVWVTIDLNQPNRGWIVVSQEPLEELLKGMNP